MNEKTTQRIGFGGGCHWCTEAVFQSLRGVSKVEQGFIASAAPHDTDSEAVIVHFDSQQISLELLIEIHLHTHASTSNHTMRGKYRSAIYAFNPQQAEQAKQALKQLQPNFSEPLVTQVLPYVSFKSSDDRFHNYYANDPTRPFCQTYIDPKIALLQQRYAESVSKDKH